MRNNETVARKWCIRLDRRESDIMKTTRKLITFLLSVAMISCLTFTTVHAEPIMEGEFEIGEIHRNEDNVNVDNDEGDDEEDKDEGNEDIVPLKLDGNAIDNIDNSTIDAIKNILEADLWEGETSEITIVANEGSIDDCDDTATEEALDMIFDGVSVPIEKTFLDLNVVQEIFYDDGDCIGPYDIKDIDTTLDIVYTLPTDTPLKTVVCTDEISSTKLDRLDAAPDNPDSEDFSYFVDGSVVHIYIQSLSFTYGFGFADGIFEVTFDVNGGDEIIDPIYTGQLDELPKPTKSEEWEFVGWLYDDGTIAQPGDIITNNVNLTAKWERIGEFIPTKNGVYISKNDDGKGTVTLVDGLAYGKKANIDTIVGKDNKTYKITRIADEAFQNDSKITEVIIGQNVRSIGMYAFYGCDKIHSLSIGSGVEDIGFGAFANCDGLSSLEFDAETIPYGLFCDFNITKLVIGPNVKTIEDGAFAYTKITKLKTNKVTSIGREAFCDCENLVSINLGNSLITVDDGAFAGCEKIKTVNIGSGLEEISSNAFDGCESLSSVKVNMSYIPDDIFAGHDITKLTIGSNVRTIGNGAFEGCETLKKVSFNKVRVIGDRAFAETGITKVNTHKVKAIGNEAFCDCPNLTLVTIANSAEFIGREVFCNCEKLKTISIGFGMEMLDTDTFNDLPRLTTLSVNMANIPEWVFADQNITTLTLGPNVRTVGEAAFIGCDNLKTINIKSKYLTDLEALGDDCFADIKPRATIKIPAKVFKKTKAIFKEKCGAGDFIRYRKK